MRSAAGGCYADWPGTASASISSTGQSWDALDVMLGKTPDRPVDADHEIRHKMSAVTVSQLPAPDFDVAV